MTGKTAGSSRVPGRCPPPRTGQRTAGHRTRPSSPGRRNQPPLSLPSWRRSANDNYTGCQLGFHPERGDSGKMVHNGIEYGMLQAYAEGFNILQASQEFPSLDLHGIAHLWNQGSVVRSWLLELAERAFEKDPQLSELRGWVDDSGEGRWTIDEAMNLSVPAPVLVLSLMARYQSRQPDGFGNKVIAALRNEFGGDAVKSEDKAASSPTVL